MAASKELFNVSGDKFYIVEKITKRKKAYGQSADASAPERVKVSYKRTQAMLLEKRKKFLYNRFIDSTTKETFKVAIIGDEIRLRRDIVLGFPINTRDGTVSS